MPLTIRRAGQADAPVVIDFNQRLAYESEGKTLDPALLEPGVKAGLEDPHKALYFLAEEDGRALGLTMITTEWSDWRNGWMWWVQSVYVRPEARRRGIFRALFDHIHKAARRDPGVAALRLYVEQDNKAAQQTYLQMGMAWTSYLVMERYPLETDGNAPGEAATR
jgi:GNAT superfamily N-acetyltransferase